jgi:hypothetical protein
MTDRRSTAGMLAGLASVAALVAACAGSTATPPIVYITPAVSTGPIVVVATATPALTPTPAPTLVPVVGASWPATPTIVATIQSEGGSTASCSTWTVTMHKPVVTGIPSAGAMNSAISALVDGWIGDFKKRLGEGGGAGPCTLDGTFTVGIASQTLVGIAFANQVYLGGASTGSAAGSINFVSSTAAPIVFGDLFTDAGAAAEILSKQSRTLLATALASDGDAALIAAGTGQALSNFDKAFVLTPAGLQLWFAELQVGPAALGTPAITVPWSALAGVLNADGPAAQFITAPTSSPSAS